MGARRSTCARPRRRTSSRRRCRSCSPDRTRVRTRLDGGAGQTDSRRARTTRADRRGDLNGIAGPPRPADRARPRPQARPGPAEGGSVALDSLLHLGLHARPEMLGRRTALMQGLQGRRFRKLQVWHRWPTRGAESTGRVAMRAALARRPGPARTARRRSRGPRRTGAEIVPASTSGLARDPLRRPSTTARVKHERFLRPGVRARSTRSSARSGAKTGLCDDAPGRRMVFDASGPSHRTTFRAGICAHRASVRAVRTSRGRGHSVPIGNADHPDGQTRPHRERRLTCIPW